MNEAMQTRFLTARRALIAAQFSDLNDRQLEAALTTEGPLLLLAGAGSGKTTVLIRRIANLIRFGCASDSQEIPAYVTEENVLQLEQALAAGVMDDAVAALCALRPAAPWSIIAITFTNKAANELKTRLANLLGNEALDIWAMTFHSACCRILRREISRLGYDSRFTIYDTADSERVMKDVMKDLSVDEKTLPAKTILNYISRAKDRMELPAEFAAEAKSSGDYRMELMARCYDAYQTRLQEANALDFDDIILLTVRLLQDFDEVRDFYQRKFRYVLIDEYQDTNHLQYLLASLLAGGYENICVVGDDDQSIYRFRGATITNILSFENQFRGAKLIRLEQNYRSTQSILDAANAVIAHNRGRKGKKLWTKNETGEKIVVYNAMNESDEATFVAGRIFSMQPKARFKDFCVLYRTNAQSNALEKAFKANAIPYRIIGGTRFFDRAEVKDMLAYLWVLSNRADDLRLRRIINNPPRGIGVKTLETATRLAEASGMPLYAVLSDPDSYPALEKAAGKLKTFVQLIEQCAARLNELALPEFYDELLAYTGYAAMLESKDDIDSRTRLENVRELRSSLVGYVQNHPDDASLEGFLEEIALYTDIEQYDPEADAVVMMTMHAAKGLEFPHVCIVGAEEGVFPSLRSADDQSMEEERRLCYVAMTRAKKTLAICHADQRMLYGHTTANRVSRFVEEIPEELITGRTKKQPKPAASSWGGYTPSSRPGWGQTRRPQSSVYRPAVPTTEAAVVDYRPGDMVEHKSFGRGMVLSSLKMGNDALLEIAFDEKGTRKLMARTAAAHMKKL